tara:strand:+ start:783 stop:1004 length:222 start_codon:yes stop_codon:yes gene_type:complete
MHIRKNPYDNPEIRKRRKILHKILVVPAAQMSQLARITKHRKKPVMLNDKELRRQQIAQCKKFGIDPATVNLT